MRCKICGEKLKKEGDICNSCLSKIKEEEKLKKDTKVKYEIKKDFILGYMLLHKIDALIALIIVYIATIIVIQKWYVAAIITVFIVIITIIDLIFKSNNVEKSYCRFYKYQMKLKNFPYKEITIKYSDIKDISYMQDMVQSIFKVGDLRISYYTGNLVNTIKIYSNVKNPEKVMEELQKIVKK